jgi:hypothetical protein
MFREGGTIAGRDCAGFFCGAELLVGKDCHNEMELDVSCKEEGRKKRLQTERSGSMNSSKSTSSHVLARPQYFRGASGPSSMSHLNTLILPW